MLSKGQVVRDYGAGLHKQIFDDKVIYGTIYT